MYNVLDKTKIILWLFLILILYSGKFVVSASSFSNRGLTPVNGGSLKWYGPNNNSEKITVIAVSDDLFDDSVPVTYTVKGSKGVSEIHLAFSIKDTNVISSNTLSCDIQINQNGDGKCQAIKITPVKYGNTRLSIDFKNSYWISKHLVQKQKLITLYPFGVSPVKISVGTVYAGYQNDIIHSKFTEYNISDQKKGVSTLKLSSNNNILYAVDGNGVYKKKLGKLFADTPLEKIATLPNKDTAKAVELMAGSNKLLIGSSKGNIFGVTDRQWLAVESPALLQTLDNSVGISTRDNITNIAYFIDSANNLAIYYTDRWLNEFWYTSPMVITDDIYAKVTSVTANAGKVYVAADTYDAQFNGCSTLYKWVNKQMSRVTIAGDNPFINDNYISKLAFFNDELYASGSDGILYKLNIAKTELPYWEIIPDLAVGSIADFTVDKNGNIYVASGFSGVWKIPFDHSKKAYKIYTSMVKSARSIQIDNGQ